MITKYGFELRAHDIEVNVRRLTNQLWKLIPMRENEEDWRKQLNTVTIEIAGLNEIFNSKSQFLELLEKLKGLQVIEVDFETYRRTIFESLNLLQEAKKND
mgnify:CR=1 FL=1